VNLSDFLIYLATGRLFIWLLQTAGLLTPLFRGKLLQELRACDLCLGFWVYLILGLFTRTNPLNIWPSIVSKTALAGLATLMAHLLRIGYQTKFGVTVID
jgi:hypothetical protein